MIVNVDMLSNGLVRVQGCKLALNDSLGTFGSSFDKVLVNLDLCTLFLNPHKVSVRS